MSMINKYIKYVILIILFSSKQAYAVEKNINSNVKSITAHEFEIALENILKDNITTILGGDTNFIINVSARINQIDRNVNVSDIDLITENFSSGNILDQYPRFKGVNIELILDNKISKDKENAIIAFVKKKAKIESIRGDSLKITKTDLSFKTINMIKKYTKEIILAALGLLVFIFILFLLFRFKKSLKDIKESSTNTNVSDTKNNNFDNENKASINNKKVTEDLINLCLSNIDSANQTIKELAQTEKGKDIIANVYNALGESIFKKLFNGFDSDGINKNINSSERELEKFNLLLSQNLKNNVTTVAPFKFLDKLSINQLKYLIEEETYPIKALVISQLNDENAKTLMLDIEPQEQMKISYELTNLENIPLKLYKNAAIRLSKNANDIPHYNSLDVKGYNALLGILNKMNNSEINNFFTSTKELQPDLYHKVRDFFFIFEDLEHIEHEFLRTLLSPIPRKLIAESIYNESKSFKETVIKALPKKIALSVKEELEMPVEADMISKAKESIVFTVRNQLKEKNIKLKEIKEKE